MKKLLDAIRNPAPGVHLVSSGFKPIDDKAVCPGFSKHTFAPCKKLWRHKGICG